MYIAAPSSVHFNYHLISPSLHSFQVGRYKYASVSFKIRKSKVYNVLSFSFRLTQWRGRAGLKGRSVNYSNTAAGTLQLFWCILDICIRMLKSSTLCPPFALSPVQSAWPGDPGQGLWGCRSSMDNQFPEDTVLPPGALRAPHATEKLSPN